MEIVQNILDTTAKVFKVENIPADEDIPSEVAKKVYQQDEMRRSANLKPLFIGSGEDAGAMFQDCQC